MDQTIHASIAIESWGIEMNDNDDAAYYLARAEEEEDAALKTANPIAADIHRSLANRYRARASEFQGHPKLSLARD